MPQSDDDYKRRLVARIASGGALPPEHPTAASRRLGGSIRGMDKAEWLMRPGIGVPQFMPGPPAGAAMGVVKASAPLFEEGGAALLSRLPSNLVQSALDAARMEGKYAASGIMDDALAQGQRFSQSNIPRAASHAEDAFFSFFDDLARMGVKPQTATRFLKGFSRYADDPVEALADMGVNLEKVGPNQPNFKEELIQRLYRNINSAVENNWFS